MCMKYSIIEHFDKKIFWDFHGNYRFSKILLHENILDKKQYTSFVRSIVQRSTYFGVVRNFNKNNGFLEKNEIITV